MKKRYSAGLVALFVAPCLFAADVIVDSATKQTNKTLSTTPILLDVAQPFAQVRVLAASGAQTWKLGLISITNLVINKQIGDIMSNSLGTITVGPNETNVFSRNSAYGLWRGPIWGMANAADTNNISVLVLK